MKRAAHQLIDHPTIFVDPLALKIIGKEQAVRLQANLRQFESGPLSSYVRGFVATRSRYAEDQLDLAVGQGVRQYVILGAGFDTFAYRNPYPGGMLRVFEVDHPATQTWKRACLKEAGITLPDDLTFPPVDFET